MKVFCPRCNTGYEIDDELLKLKSRRMRCGVCGEIFTVDKIVEEDVSENAFGMLQEAMGGQSKEDKNPPVDEMMLNRMKIQRRKIQRLKILKLKMKNLILKIFLSAYPNEPKI